MKFENSGNKDTRSGFGAGLAELGRTNPDVVALCADLTGSLKMDQFAKENPQLEFKAGVVEGTYYDAEGINVIADIPSREALISRLLGSMQSPITNFARVIKQIAEKGEAAE